MDDDQSSIFIPGEIVADILIRLPITPLFRFKLVSKRWNSIISDQEFGLNYLQRLRSSPKSSPLGQNYLCAMLNPWGNPKNSVSTLYDIIDHDPPPSLYIPAFPNWPVYQVLASSSGLVLSSCLHPASIDTTIDLCVSNPLTKQSVLLPPLDICVKTHRWIIGFATRAASNNPTYLTYKVVVILRQSPLDNDNSTVMIFSSEEGNWTCKEQIASPKMIITVGGSCTCSCKGVLYWSHWSSRSIVTYDPYDIPDSFGLLQFPNGSSGNILRNSFMNLIQFGHEDVLTYVDIECVSDTNRELRVWRLVDYDMGKWCLEQKCPISPYFSDSFWTGTRMVCPDPCNDGFICCLVDDSPGVKAIDLRSAEDVSLDVDETECFGVAQELVPIALCPWASPFYGQDECNSSLIVGFRKIPSVWFTSSSKN